MGVVVEGAVGLVDSGRGAVGLGKEEAGAGEEEERGVAWVVGEALLWATSGKSCKSRMLQVRACVCASAFWGTELMWGGLC